MQLIKGVLDTGITEGNVSVIERLVALKERDELRQAKKDFAQALASLQAETGLIQAMSPVLNRDGTLRYKYAKFEHIMAKVQPLLAKYGFSHSFDTNWSEGKITAIFKLTHRSGHSESNQCSSAVAKGQGTNSAQDDMGAKSYAKRGAVCDGLGIVISHDEDGRDLGSGRTISAEDAAILRERVETIGANKTAFLQFAKAETFEDIDESRIAELTAMLDRKEAAAKA